VLKRLLSIALFAAAAQAHVGSPDIYVDGKAGPYQMFVTVRPPKVIPGVAGLEIRTESPGVHELRAVPVPIAGPGAKFAPIPDKLTRSKEDAQFFTGSLWMMAPGSWQVRITAVGDKGEGVLSVPVPSVAIMTKKMQRGVGLILSVLGVFLVTGMVVIVGASVREAKLDPGIQPTAVAQRKGRIAMAVAFLVLIGVLWAGNEWWKSEANNYDQTVYRPVQMSALLDQSGLLTLKLTDSGWLQPTVGGPSRLKLFSVSHSIDDLVPDHDHLMHLYAIREPGLDAVYHLHPDLVGAGVFHLQLPAMPPGTYQLYADVVHANGFPETPVAAITVPAGLPGRALTGDDASATAPDWTQSSVASTSFTLPDGYRMEWLRAAGPFRSRQGMPFRFTLIDPQGHAPRDMALYMGMLGHAAFVKTDGRVFAHIHPMGTASMTAMSLAQNRTSEKQASAGDMAGMDMTSMDMPGMDMHPTNVPAALPNEVSFPYGFPTPGRYRIFVQMKHGNTVETGVFDASVQ
jgi:hypothetical protein